LRQDERAAETDARKRASENVQSLARAMRSSVDEQLRRYVQLQNFWELELHDRGAVPDAKLQADIKTWERDYPGLRFEELALPPSTILADGRQIEPRDFPAAPRPPKWFLDLSPQQRTLWDEMRASGSVKLRDARWQDFRGSSPSAEAELAANLLNAPPEQIIGNTEASPSESGISFEEIATYQLLTATNAQLTDMLFHSVWWRVIDHASMVSPKLLQLAGSLTNQASPGFQQKFIRMQTLFNRRSEANECLAGLRQLPDLQPWKTQYWSHWTTDGSALAIFQPVTYKNPGDDYNGVSLAGHGYEVWLVPRAVTTAIFDRALRDNQFFVLPYATTEVMAEGVRLHSPNKVADKEDQPLLGEAEQQAGEIFAQNAIHFDVKFFLTSREQMLSAELRRAKLFGGLVLAAALTALAGLWSARRAFHRQLQLNEQKSNFVSSVSHELRAPIASVRLMAENLDRGKISEPAKQGEYFHFIVQECRRLSSLIENVLDFSRIEQGRKQYEFEPTNVIALTETTVKLMEPYAAEKGVSLKLETSNSQQPKLGLPTTSNIELSIDGRAIQQALVNLIDNAVKHSPKGETVTVGIEIKNGELKTDAAGSSTPINYSPRRSEAKAGQPSTTCRVEAERRRVNLSVSDHGPGIPASEHAKIFERFYRLGSELRRETQGVGIGLSVVKHIVEAHNGHVRVESEPGKGSRFIIELPVDKKSNV
jgi:signal transduction histidine kinase